MKTLPQPLASPALVFASILALAAAAAPCRAALKSAYLDSLQKNFYVEHCCASKLADCAKKKPACKIAPRLANFIAWMDSVGRNSDEKFDEALSARYLSLADKKKYAADAKGWPLIGNANAPLTVVMYISGTCPTCKSNFKEMHREVTAGSLKGKAKIIVKPFGTGVANRALAVAHDLGRFPDFMLALAEVKVRIDEEVLYSVADNLYLDRDKFKAFVESPATMKRVEQSTAEAERNGVRLVPTYLISGRRYESVSTGRWVVDAIEYAIEE
ncbi:MAG: DsbA family protein [Chitinispirillales bacterium]|nr:DsbA family protein [Chitinispirillales bacterium]